MSPSVIQPPQGAISACDIIISNNVSQGICAATLLYEVVYTKSKHLASGRANSSTTSPAVAGDTSLVNASPRAGGGGARRRRLAVSIDLLAAVGALGARCLLMLCAHESAWIAWISEELVVFTHETGGDYRIYTHIRILRILGMFDSTVFSCY